MVCRTKAKRKEMVASAWSGHFSSDILENIIGQYYNQQRAPQKLDITIATKRH